MRPMMVVLPGRSGSGIYVSISDQGVTDVEASPTSAFASFQLDSDGDVTVSPADARSDWLYGSTTGSNYECRATLVSGTLSSGTTGSWLALSSSRSWSVSRASLGTKSCTFDLEIGLAGTSTALDTARIFLTATVEAS